MPGTYDANGIYNYAEDDNIALFSDLLNLGTESISAALTAKKFGNYIINGAFEVNQRVYASGASLASGVYGLDRWKSGSAGTSLTFTAGAQGQTVTISSGGVITQVVERATLTAGTYTLAWDGTATGRIYNSGATAPSYAASPITVTLDGSANVIAEFTASGASKTLGQVRLNSGSVVAPFVRAGFTFQGELQLCKRYYQKSFSYAQAPAHGTTSTSFINDAGLLAYTASNIMQGGQFTFPVEMYTSPTILGWGNNGAQFPYLSSPTAGSRSWSVSAFSVSTQNAKSMTLTQQVVNQNIIAVAAHWTAEAEL